MKKIERCKFEMDYNEGERVPAKIWVKFSVHDSWTKKNFEVRISYEDVTRMLSGKGIYILDSGIEFEPEHLCNPGGERDFGWVVSLLLNAAYYCNTITREVYVSKVREHFEKYYLCVYNSKSKMCFDFYRRYFLESSKMKYRNYYEMIGTYAQSINEKGKVVLVKRGGEFCGCYTDEYDRRRPITSRVYYERVIPIAEKMWVCFEEEVA